MKCTNCNTENLRKANYCRNCGKAFTQQEKGEAHKRSVVGKLEKQKKQKEKQINVYFKETTGYEYQSGSYGKQKRQSIKLCLLLFISQLHLYQCLLLVEGNVGIHFRWR